MWSFFASVTFASEDRSKKKKKMSKSKSKNKYVMDSEISSLFKEKIWENGQVEGETIVDGYAFRGKRTYEKVVESFKETMVKNYQHSINGIEIKVLDSRKKGIEIEKDIEIVDGNEKGVVMLKLYGPNKKKESVVTVSRSKGQDPKFVVILVEKILKQLIESIIKGDSMEKSNSKKRPKINDEETDKKPTAFKCTQCDKTFYSNQGLKGHITRMHRGNKAQNARNVVLDSSKNEEVGNKDAKKDELIEISSETESDEEVTLKEKDSSGRKREAICEECDFKVVANRKYIALQNLRLHKDEYHSKICDKCEYKTRSYLELKRHMRDTHGIKSCSTSPAKKKKKNNMGEDEETMDIDNTNIDIKEEVEDMEIVEDKSDVTENLSLKMDIKIIEKQRKLEEEERKRREIMEKDELKRLITKENETEMQRKEKRLMKQRSKNIRRSVNKRKKQADEDVNEVRADVPNVKEVPQNVKHLVKKGDVVYQVAANGACFPNSAAAFFFQDEVFGPKLRKRMNYFFVEHYTKKYENLSPCSEASPFLMKNRNGKVMSFTDREKLFNYLKSPDSEYMWSDCVDLVVIADMYQVKIQVITMKSLSDPNPTENWIYPDKEMEAFAELKNVDQNDLVLLHEDETHFNLIISKDSDLAKFGSLSNRFNFESIKNSDLGNNDSKSANKDTDNISDMKKELKIVKENMIKLQKEYNKCEEPAKPERIEIYNYKDEASKVIFKKLTSETEEFTKCFDDQTPLIEQIQNWTKLMDKFCSKSFKKIRIKKNNIKPINPYLKKLINERNSLLKYPHNSQTGRNIEDITKRIYEIEAEENRNKIIKNFKEFSDNPENVNLHNVWKKIKQIWPKYCSTIPTAKKNHQGKIVTGPKDIKNLLAREYRDRLRSRPTRPDLKTLRSRKRQIFQMKLEISKTRKIQKMCCLFLHYILQQDENSNVYRMFKLQQEMPTTGDWASMCMKDLKELEISESLKEIKIMTKKRI